MVLHRPATVSISSFDIGHGLEADGTFYCCDHGAEEEGVTGLKDRA